MTLEDFILDYIRQRRSVTFGEVKKAGADAGYPMDGDLELGDDDAYLWSRMSQEFAEAVSNLVGSQKVRLVPTTQLDIMVTSPIILRAEQPPIPCRLEAN